MYLQNMVTIVILREIISNHSLMTRGIEWLAARENKGDLNNVISL